MTKTITIEVPEDAEVQVLVDGEPYETEKKSWAWAWVPEKGEKVYWLTSAGIIETASFEQSLFDAELRQGNIFRTKEEAELENDRRALNYELKQWAAEYNEGWGPDWGDRKKRKYYLSYAHCDNKWLYFSESGLESPSTIYFKDCNFLDPLVKHFGDRLDLLRSV